MQGFDVLGFLLCTLATFASFLKEVQIGELLFGVSVVALLISTKAPNIVLDGIEDT